MAQYRIVLAGGGSGGHIYPLVTVARVLQETLGASLEMQYIGARGTLEREAFGSVQIPIRSIATGKWRRYASILNVIDIFRVGFGVLQSLWHLLVFMPDAIFSKGGAPAVPVVIAAWLYRIPILTHESDAVPGVANRIIGAFANRIAVGYPSAKTYFEGSKTVVTGNPVRPELLLGQSQRARERWGLLGDRPTLLILGGSQGATSLNTSIARISLQLLEHFEIIHQTGVGKDEAVTQILSEYGVSPGERPYVVAPFLDTEMMADALSIADVVIARAGAGAITEIAGGGRAVAILIPHGVGSSGHQRMNAYEVARVGGALVLDEPNLGENMLLHKTVRLWYDEPTRKKMVEALKAFYHPDAARVIATGIIGLLKR